MKTALTGRSGTVGGDVRPERAPRPRKVAQAALGQPPPGSAAAINPIDKQKSLAALATNTILEARNADGPRSSGKCPIRRILMPLVRVTMIKGKSPDYIK